MIVQGLPHACGGVSADTNAAAEPIASSPRMWGCFQQSAGLSGQNSRLPHACGGVSLTFGLNPTMAESSPRMWGCFHVIVPYPRLNLVFPTHVGVFLSIVSYVAAQ